jgi:REP element-mobilizing transposase RayT
MGSTLSNLLYHVVFSTKDREPIITSKLREELYRYLGGIVKGEEGTSLQIGGMSDHVHLVLKLKPVHSISEFMRKVKGNSSKWINEMHGQGRRFSWQEGYGAFSISPSQLNHVIQYVKRQEEHHKKISFKDEFVQLLKRHHVEYDERYIWS